MAAEAGRVLLVDDDRELSAMLGEYIGHEGFAVERAFDGESGLAQLRDAGADIVVLDVMMPRVSGMEVLRRLRAFSGVPVLMLTARGDDVDCVLSLELGADDYVQKPCTPRELVARLRAILRRTSAARIQALTDDAITVGALAVWPQRRQAAYGSTPLALTSSEYNLLEVLARHAGSVVTKNDLSQLALGRSMGLFDRNVDVHVSAIRQKLAQVAGERTLIQTVRGVGYQLIRE
ncbi:response regulator transcription factor [Methyloversatilis sp.]|uniref:response regulator transcription factor n=1 Tax=Methyloversatilis sp. TaxID=2569862 RepID=UPI00273439C7|nr:response regulator transcription factor [Methyloversatilis sp.]MDP2869265.1 response regulator transcription factor [Methyloversatilis sp.]MDP3287170.1 response regulator transcription factor [Methyloversatilis sp.]MDP3454731.1 response regulator transcription factor [Methyloversatilis sp.]MDP3577043.1 response regulator transcription factor [Methyloversatilis sp.]